MDYDLWGLDSIERNLVNPWGLRGYAAGSARLCESNSNIVSKISKNVLFPVNQNISSVGIIDTM